MIYIASDHGGFELKEQLKPNLKEMGYEVFDFGANVLEKSDDYPDYALPVAEKVASDGSFGILLCRGGQGMAILANKVKGIRAAVCWDVNGARKAREKNNANILSLPSDTLSIEQAQEIVRVFLETPFSEAKRHQRRIAKISDYESKHWLSNS